MRTITATPDDTVPTTSRVRTRVWPIVVAPVAGAALGAVARGWMRLITDDPEFSWSGTIFIVMAFTILGAGHGLAWAVRVPMARRRWSTPARIAGAVLTMPIFVGAGGLMLPTVFGASLASWRRDWPRPVRAGLWLLAAAPPALIATDVVRGGVTSARVFGLALLALTYAAVVRSAAAVVAPVDDGWRMRRAVRVVLAVATALLALQVAVFAVGITTA